MQNLYLLTKRKLVINQAFAALFFYKHSVCYPDYGMINSYADLNVVRTSKNEKYQACT